MARRRDEVEVMEAKLRYFIGVSLTLILGGTIFVILYSLVFVTQPIGETSENDRKFFELLTPIAAMIVGALGGIMAAGSVHRDKDDDDDTDGKGEPK
jgi:hypothetical protein